LVVNSWAWHLLAERAPFYPPKGLEEDTFSEVRTIRVQHAWAFLAYGTGAMGRVKTVAQFCITDSAG
jgi:hypothetical protein